ncbi:hypothetical protein A2188_01985 [Candidatus Woesebacteria bacterium RIFOXYA1_FULL_43_9]|uniref:NAD-dependent epimerase/dehydratase domain-containing protein n=1 Tax=Candidatus Woesebacteria bacterium RIFOXYA1_FULL_43_9 TaxID=1802534 RepID=A0A1F8CN05_9BACT|nr:MAG: hypothetical protein A2188_01985 [Candidatus Woesebacteria bacterium RIFOXYA1_FULL_43_9]
MGKKILVTGGAGFIGSHLCEQLVAKKHQVICLDNLFSGSKKNLTTIINNPHFRFVKGDVRQKELVDKLVAEVDMIYHLAAIVGVSVVVNQPLENIDVNFFGIRNITESAYKHGKKKVLFTSSSEVYGKNSLVPLVENLSDQVFGGTNVTRWAYGEAKALGEHLLYAYAEKGLPFAVVRYFNCYGPRGINPNYANVVPKFIGQALKNEVITIHESGRATRCFCYVDDTVQGTILAGEKLNRDVVNIGSNKEISILDLAKKIIGASGSQSKITHLNEQKIFSKKYESSQRRVPSVLKAEKLLGFKPKTSLNQGLTKTITWTRNQISK